MYNRQTIISPNVARELMELVISYSSQPITESPVQFVHSNVDIVKISCLLMR